jgi:hypothetical protein
MGACQPGLSLFLVCRQIYTEASSVFYKHNIFRICWYRSLKHSAHDINGRYITRAAVPWLKRIGNHIQMLRKLELDVNNVCSTHCRIGRMGYWARTTLHAEALIDLGPILCIIWREGLNALEVSFVKPKKNMRNCPIAQIRGFPLQTSYGCDVPALNKLMRSLLRDDLDIKKYCRSIDSISIRRDGSGGLVAFWSSSAVGMWYLGPHNVTAYHQPAASMHTDNVSFFEANQGTHLRLLARELPTLSTLTMGLRHQIVHYALSYGQDYRINLDTPDDLRALTGPCFVNKSWLHAYTHLLYKNSYILEVTSDNARSLERLKRLLGTKFYTRRGDAHRSVDDPVTELRMFGKVAEFRVQLDVIGPEVRFDVVPFIKATVILAGEREVTIASHGSGDPGNGVVDRINTVTLNQIRRNAMLAWPIDESDSKVECPEIWMDGEGRVVDVRKSEAYIEFAAAGDLLRGVNAAIAGGAVMTHTREGAYPKDESSFEMLGWLRRSCLETVA